MKQRISTVITDLDNTLFDWVEMWGAAFTALLEELVRRSGVDRELLLSEIKTIHQRHGTSEYAFLIQDLPSLQALHPGEDLKAIYYDAILAYRSARDSTLKLYPDVQVTLGKIRELGCQIIGYTESMAFYSSYRIRALGLDGVLDCLFSPPDHAKPEGFARSKPTDSYGLISTRHEHTPEGEYKPNPMLLRDIMKRVSAHPDETLYLGDSLMKDVAMAQDAGVVDVHARYGMAQHTDIYGLLKRVTHWSDAQVAREKAINADRSVEPTVALTASIKELFDHFTFGKREP